MKVIVKGEEECDAIVVFPCLKSLKLYDLESLEGFCLGKEAFEFPSLDTLQIDRCEEMRVFTKGDVSTPKLYAISSRCCLKSLKLDRLFRLEGFCLGKEAFEFPSLDTLEIE
ncbi:hypothetical protein Tco_0263850, partial [Tanacetum coccineum]